MAHRNVLAVDFGGNQGQLFAMEEETGVGGVRIGAKSDLGQNAGFRGVQLERKLDAVDQIAKGGVILKVDRLRGRIAHHRTPYIVVR